MSRLVNVFMHSFRMPVNFPSQDTQRFVRDPDHDDTGMWGDIPILGTGLCKVGAYLQEFHWSYFGVNTNES